MTRRLLGPVGGPILFFCVAALVAAGLGWVTVAALRVERAQREGAARAELETALRIALWKLDCRMLPTLGVEDSRPYYHFSPGDLATSYGPASAPLLEADLPDWMHLHFQLDADGGWDSPQVMTPDTANRIRQLWPDLKFRNVTPDREARLNRLRAAYPARELADTLAARDRATPADSPLATGLFNVQEVEPVQQHPDSGPVPPQSAVPIITPPPPATPPAPLTGAEARRSVRVLGREVWLDDAAGKLTLVRPASTRDGVKEVAANGPETAAPPRAPAAQPPIRSAPADGANVGNAANPAVPAPRGMSQAVNPQGGGRGGAENRLNYDNNGSARQKTISDAFREAEALRSGRGDVQLYGKAGQAGMPPPNFQQVPPVAPGATATAQGNITNGGFGGGFSGGGAGTPPFGGAGGSPGGGYGAGSGGPGGARPAASLPTPATIAPPAVGPTVLATPAGPPVTAPAAGGRGSSTPLSGGSPPPGMPVPAPVLPGGIGGFGGRPSTAAKFDAAPKNVPRDTPAGNPAGPTDLHAPKKSAAGDTAEAATGAKGGARKAGSDPLGEATAAGDSDKKKAEDAGSFFERLQSFRLRALGEKGPGEKQMKDANRDEANRDADRRANEPALPAPTTDPAGDAIPMPPPVAVHLGSMRPQWLPSPADRPGELVLVRAAKVDGKTIYQGVLIDWEKLEVVLLDEVKEQLPGARLVPVRDPAGVSPERAMASLPVQLDPGAAAELPPAGMTPLRLGLVLAWAAAVIAFAAVGLCGWSLIDSSERRMRFVSAVTHELRTPLTSLRLYIDLLLSGMVRDEEKRQEYLATLNVESDRLHRLIDNVLDFARLEGRRRKTAEHPTCVGEILDQVRQTWGDRCGNDGKELIVISTLPPDQAVCTDVQLVQQIVGNLIDNARKYTRDAADQRIWLWAKPDGPKRVLLEVEDRGPGVPPRERRSIFHPFRRGDDADARAGGAGLGLALAKQWAEALGGRLTYRPADGGTGACFRLELRVK